MNGAKGRIVVMKKMVKLEKAGFTLMELILVIGLLSLLTILIIPNYLPKIEKAKVGEAVAMVNAIRQGEKAYWLDEGQYLQIPIGTSSSVEWGKLGLDDLNPTATGTWSFGVIVYNGGSTPQGRDFIAVAKRINATGTPWSAHEGTCIGLDKDGKYLISNANVAAVCAAKHAFSPS